MKKLIVFFIVALSALSMNLNAQALVSDPALLEATASNWAAQLDQAAKQVTAAQEQASTLSEQMEMWKKVSDIVKNSTQIIRIVEKQIKIVNLTSQYVKEAQGSIADEKLFQAYCKKMGNYIALTKEGVILLKDVLTDNKLKMSDYERMESIDKVDARLSSILNSCHETNKKYVKYNNHLLELKRLSER